MKLALEKRLRTAIPVSHPVFSWLLLHAGETLNRFQVDRAGKTAYERWKGKKYHGLVLEFGAKCHFRHPTQRSGDMRPRWSTGIWLGKTRRSDEHIVWFEDQVVRAGSIRCYPEEESWDHSMVDSISAHPWPKPSRSEGDPVEPAARLSDPALPEPLVEPREAKGPPIPRSFKVTMQHLRKHGFLRVVPSV